MVDAGHLVGQVLTVDRKSTAREEYHSTETRSIVNTEDSIKMISIVLLTFWIKMQETKVRLKQKKVYRPVSQIGNPSAPILIDFAPANPSTLLRKMYYS